MKGETESRTQGKKSKSKSKRNGEEKRTGNNKTRRRDSLREEGGNGKGGWMEREWIEPTRLGERGTGYDEDQLA
jgi:hypothetical protein